MAQIKIVPIMPVIRRVVHSYTERSFVLINNAKCYGKVGAIVLHVICFDFFFLFLIEISVL